MGFIHPDQAGKPVLNNMMFDLETGGRRPGAVIRSIGAVLFDPQAGVQPWDAFTETFYVNVDCDGTALQWDPETRAFWDGLPDAEILLTTDQVPLRDGLLQFLAWMNKFNIQEYWANSPSFDKVLIEHAMESMGLAWPLQFWSERDVRTIRGIAFNSKPPNLNEGIPHHALSDAIAQARMVQLAYKCLGLS